MSESVTSSIERVAKSSTHSGEAAEHMVVEAAQLSKQATMLQTEIDKFLLSMKAT